MGNFKIQTGDRARVKSCKAGELYHNFPEGTVVRLVRQYKRKVHGFYAYYCTAESGELKGLTQLLTTHSLEKIEN